MRGSRLGWVAVVLALVAVFGALATHSAPPGGHGIGIWPIGGATACLMISPRPRTSVLLVVIGLIGVASIWLGGRDLDVAVGLGVGLAAEAGVVWSIAADGRRERPPLRTSVDLARLLAAVACGGVAMATAGALTSVVTGFGEPGVLALTVATSSVLAQLTVLPFFCRLRNHAPLARPAERMAQWVLVLVLAPLVFVPEDFPSIVFTILPVLVWGALRSSPYESMAQLIAVLAFAIPLTTWGHGPFANAGPRFGVSVDGQGILLGTFGSVCALVVLPLILAVGEQLENARQAAAERDRVQYIVDGTTDVAIIGTDDQGIISLFNPGAERLLGYAAEEVVGRPTRMLHSDEAIAEKSAELGVVNDYGAMGAALIGIGTTELKFVRKDGEERSHAVSLNQVEDDRGQVIGFVSTSEDITERIEAERRLVEAVERLREVDQVKDAFVSSVSHELRTPITSILGYTEMLEDGVYGELAVEQLDAVRRLSANSTRLLSLIDDLLTLSRVQEDGLGFADRVVDLRTIVAAAASVVAPTLERRELELNVDLPEEPIPFLGDRDMLERVVINLLGNAVKFTPEGGRIDVALVADVDAAVIEVADTGIGIPPEEQERLFSRFFRSSIAQKQAIPGSGLGLSIAHAIVDQHGGTMSVESEPGHGTTFRVRLPLLTAA